MAQVTTLLDTEAAGLTADLAATPAPSNYAQVVIRRTLDWIARMRQATGEASGDYRERLNLIAQQAPAGRWSTSFFAQLEAAIASDHADPVKGGNGRSAS